MATTSGGKVFGYATPLALLVLLVLVGGGNERGGVVVLVAAASSSSSSPLASALRHLRNQHRLGRRLRQQQQEQQQATDGGDPVQELYRNDQSRFSSRTLQNNGNESTTSDDVMIGNNETANDDTSSDQVCNDNGMFVLKDDDYLYRDESNLQCDYCNAYNVSEFVTIPSQGGLDDIETATLQAVIAETQLYNYSCRNADGCTTCFDVPSSTAAVEEFSEYCGLIETMSYIVVNPDADNVSVLSNSNSNSSNDSSTIATSTTNATTTADDSAAALGLYLQQLFVGGVQVCLTYDDSSTTAAEAGTRVCMGAVVGGTDYTSSDSTDSTTSTTSTQTTMSNGTYGNQCYVEYNGVRCNSCSDYFTDNLTSCLTADCSNLDILDTDTSLYNMPMDTCSKTNPFVGPLRFVETLIDLENFAATSRPGSCSLNTNGNGNGDDSGNDSDSGTSASAAAMTTTRLGAYTATSFQTAAWMTITIFWAGSWVL